MDELDENDFKMLNKFKKRVTIQSGNILEAPEKYILIDNCSVGSLNNKYTGIKKKIFDKFPYADMYGQVEKKIVNLPGSISIKGTGQPDQRYIINLFT